MHHLRRAPLANLSVVALLLAACSSSTASPGWTYEPPPPATPTPLVTVAPSGLPSSAPSGSPSSAPSGEPAGQVINIVAHNVAYDQNNLEVTSGQPFTIQFSNQDAGVPHNVAIKDATGTELFKGEIVTGVTTATYQVRALAKGDYSFSCSVHPNMTGTLSAL